MSSAYNHRPSIGHQSRKLQACEELGWVINCKNIEGRQAAKQEEKRGGWQTGESVARATYPAGGDASQAGGGECHQAGRETQGPLSTGRERGESVSWDKIPAFSISFLCFPAPVKI